MRLNDEMTSNVVCLMPFIPLAKCATDIAELQPISSAKVYGVELAAGNKFLADLALGISDPNQWQSAQTVRSIKPAQFDEDGAFNHVRAELMVEKPAEEAESEETKEEEPKEDKPAVPQPDQRRRFRRPRSRPSGDSARRRAQSSEGIGGMLRPLDGYKLLSLKCNNPTAGIALKGEQLPVLVDSSGLIHHPVGVIALGKVGGQYVCEFDYCSLTDEGITGGLTIAEDGSVARPFPDVLWLTEQAQSIFEFYAIYLVKSGRNAIITSVQPAGSQTAAGFKEYEGFLTK